MTENSEASLSIATASMGLAADIFVFDLWMLLGISVWFFCFLLVALSSWTESECVFVCSCWTLFRPGSARPLFLLRRHLRPLCIGQPLIRSPTLLYRWIVCGCATSPGPDAKGRVRRPEPSLRGKHSRCRDFAGPPKW